MYNKPEVYRIATEDPDGMTFATCRTWIRITENQLPDLNCYAIVSSMIGTTGIYHVLMDTNPANFLTNREDAFKLLKYTVDEETGKLIMLEMNITSDEATEFINHDRHIA